MTRRNSTIRNSTIRAMRLCVLLAASTMAMAADKPASVSAAGTILRSTAVTLPFGDAVFPGGKAAEAINNDCLVCHSAKMVTMQPALSRKTWAEEVAKMRKVYGAPLPEEDVPAIVDYLAGSKPGP